MLGKAFNGSLRLQLDDAWHECRGAAELDALLRARAAPSGDFLTRLVGAGEHELMAARAACVEREEQLQGLVDAWMQGRAVNLDGRDIATDQGWDQVMRVVAAGDRDAQGYRFVAVERYRQYLRSVLKCVDSIAMGRAAVDGDDAVARHAGQQRGETAVQRLLFDLQALVGDATRAQAMERLPRGEPVSVRFGAHQSMTLRLARSDFILVSGSTFLLVDDAGADLHLPARRAVIGRASSCNVVLDPRYRSVSRRHLLVDLDDDGTVHLTDISSMGTFIPATLVPG